MTTFLSPLPRVNRDPELAFIAQMARGEIETRIALIQAVSGMGKSELVREFEHRCPDNVHQVIVDFKGGSLSLAFVFFHICDTLGWSHFQTLARTIQRLLNPANINVTGNLMWGQNDINIALNAPDEQTRDLRRADLTNALFIDLRALGRVALIFDTFEQCESTVQSWIVSAFLPAAHRSPNLSIIISGQISPERSTMWECHFIELEPITPDHWHNYARAIGAILSLEQIEQCCKNCKGISIEIANVIGIFAPRRLIHE